MRINYGAPLLCDEFGIYFSFFKNNFDDFIDIIDIEIKLANQFSG